jgi:hypothetical protein
MPELMPWCPALRAVLLAEGRFLRSLVTVDYLRISGGLITLVIVPVLPGSAPLGDKYRNGSLVMLSVAAFLFSSYWPGWGYGW